ncbi:MAG: hypothetical protein R2817_14520 [Flavobacteriales bacterium]
MAYTTIQGQTPLGTNKPGNLKGTIGVDLMAAAGAPNGIGVSVVGMLTNGNPGMYGMVFGYSTPAGMKVDPNQSGSLMSKGSSHYDMMKVVVVRDATVKSASTEYWEVWFLETDVNKDDWSTEVSMIVDGNTNTYVLTKKRTGGELDEEFTDEQLSPSGYDRKEG